MSKDYYVFTDSKTLYAKENDNVHVIEQKNLGWPGNTLYRFHMFLSQKEELQKYKYIFFMNANAICLQEVGEEFLPKDEGLLFVQHPGFYKKKNNKDFTYERNVNSTAYIPMGEGTYYVQGSVNGGKANDFLQMCEVLKNKIDEDDKNGIVAVWHDESHLNKYIVNLEPNQYKLLNISYNYAHYTHDKLYEPKIYLRKKDKYFDVSKVKSNLYIRNLIKRKFGINYNNERKRRNNKKQKRWNNKLKYKKNIGIKYLKLNLNFILNHL